MGSWAIGDDGDKDDFDRWYNSSSRARPLLIIVDYFNDSIKAKEIIQPEEHTERLIS